MTPSDLASQLNLYADTAYRASIGAYADHDDPYCVGKRQAYSHAAQLVREELVPRWTTKTPTQEGYYWRRDRYGVVSIEDIGYVGNGTREGSRLEMCYGSDMGYIYLQDDERDTMWCGPLVKPPTP